MPIKIHDKEYLTVAERVVEFRSKYNDYKLISEILELNEESILIKASILNEKNEVVATGLAQENRNASQINRTSFVENCETSAWGRALANLGLVGTELCSADELVNALNQQAEVKKYEPKKQQPKENVPFVNNKATVVVNPTDLSKFQKVMKLIKDSAVTVDDVKEIAKDKFNGIKVNDLNDDQFKELVDEIERRKAEVSQDDLPFDF